MAITLVLNSERTTSEALEAVLASPPASDAELPAFWAATAALWGGALEPYCAVVAPGGVAPDTPVPVAEARAAAPCMFLACPAGCLAGPRCRFRHDPAWLSALRGCLQRREASVPVEQLSRRVPLPPNNSVRHAMSCSAAGCAARGSKRCSRCQTARYCSAACQRAHWRQHKRDCKAFRRLQMKQGQGTTAAGSSGGGGAGGAGSMQVFPIASVEGYFTVMVQPDGGGLTCMHATFPPGVPMAAIMAGGGGAQAPPVTYPSVQHAPPSLQLLLCCGVLPDPQRVRSLAGTAATAAAAPADAADAPSGGAPPPPPPSPPPSLPLDVNSVRLPGAGLLPLELAARKSNLAVMRVLLRDCGARVDVGAPLLWAAYTDSLEACKELLAAGAPLEARQRRTGRTAACVAAESGSVACLRWLLETAGADGRASGADGADVLALAHACQVEEARAKMVPFLQRFLRHE